MMLKKSIKFIFKTLVKIIRFKIHNTKLDLLIKEIVIIKVIIKKSHRF